MNTESLIAQLKQKSEDLVKRGGDIKEETSRLVSEAAGQCHAAAGGLAAMVKAVADGAMAGASHKAPEGTETVLRQVVGGITDGVLKSAQALKLTLEESAGKGTRFAKEDLTKIGHDFRTLGNDFSGIVTGAASALGNHAKEQVATLSSHARQTLEAAWPPLEAALGAAQHEPVQLGREAVDAGTAAARQAAGVLFSELGQLLQKAGEKLRH